MSIYKQYEQKYLEETKNNKVAFVNKDIWIVIHFLEDKNIMPGEIDKLTAAAEELTSQNEYEMLEAIRVFLEQITRSEK